VEPIDVAIRAEQTPRSSLFAKLIGATLAAYWLLLVLGMHLPVRVSGPPWVGDKLVHWAAYTGLAFLLALAAQTRCRLGLLGYLGILILTAGYGALDELGQLPIPGRQADFRDWIADLAGIATGLACHRLLAVPLLSQLNRRRRAHLPQFRQFPESLPVGSDFKSHVF
jgi:VanZ family protein